MSQPKRTGIPRQRVEKRIELRGKPFLILSQLPDGGVETMIVTDTFKNVGEWGIAVADLVQHVSNAFAQEGYEYDDVHAEVKEIVLMELAKPTAKMKVGPHVMGVTPIEE